MENQQFTFPLTETKGVDTIGPNTIGPNTFDPRYIWPKIHLAHGYIWPKLHLTQDTFNKRDCDKCEYSTKTPSYLKQH